VVFTIVKVQLVAVVVVDIIPFVWIAKWSPIFNRFAGKVNCAWVLSRVVAVVPVLAGPAACRVTKV
jgi:hypothetical protein